MPRTWSEPRDPAPGPVKDRDRPGQAARREARLSLEGDHHGCSFQRGVDRGDLRNGTRNLQRSRLPGPQLDHDRRGHQSVTSAANMPRSSTSRSRPARLRSSKEATTRARSSSSSAIDDDDAGQALLRTPRRATTTTASGHHSERIDAILLPGPGHELQDQCRRRRRHHRRHRNARDHQQRRWRRHRQGPGS
jgi:hypothetical protein